jgi:hypothetical protein
MSIKVEELRVWAAAVARASQHWMGCDLEVRIERALEATELAEMRKVGTGAAAFLHGLCDAEEDRQAQQALRHWMLKRTSTRGGNNDDQSCG